MSKKLIYKKTFTVKTTFGPRSFHIRAWENYTLELRRLGYGSEMGWTATATLTVDPPGLKWTEKPPVINKSEQLIVQHFEQEFMKWLHDYAEVTYIETLEENAEWSLL